MEVEEHQNQAQKLAVVEQGILDFVLVEEGRILGSVVGVLGSLDCVEGVLRIQVAWRHDLLGRVGCGGRRRLEVAGRSP